MADQPRRILIDGRSGSGKTELARAVATAWPQAQLVRLDDIYPGWDGLSAGSSAVPSILEEHRWRSWDWAADRPGAQFALDPDRPIVLEGVGTISAASRPLADLAVWVELDDDTRKRRAIARDGNAYEPHWDRWANQELQLIARERPAERADIVVPGDELLRDIESWRDRVISAAVEH